MPIINKIKTIRRKTLLFFVALVFAFSVPVGILSQRVQARDFNAEIAAKEAEIAQYQAEAARLASQADTLANALAAITNEKSQIQAQIDVSQAKYDQLMADIAATEKKIVNTQDALGTTIADMYVEDQITPLEMIASSKNISEFMDKQEYRSSIRNELSTKVKEVKALKEKLDIDRKETENTLTTQKNQREVLAQKEAEQQNLVDTTRGEEQAYQNLSQRSQAALLQIQVEKAAAARAGINGSIVAGDPNHGGYPAYLENAPQDSIADPWGMLNRECVSYAAWKVEQTYGNMPHWGGIGNAWEWAFSGWKDSYNDGVQVYYDNGNWHTANYITYGIPAGDEPKVGSVAVYNGAYGHVAWVESVDGDQIRVSQFNYGVHGAYTEMVVNKSKFQKYIYFGEWNR